LALKQAVLKIDFFRSGDTALKCSLARRTNMATGTVKFFNNQKGFGFITPSDGSRDVFVHISAVERSGMSTLVEGQRVTYDVVTERGKQAADNLQAV
jgi:CspA family cold shock protein